MRCSRVRDLLPLYAGGDLPERKAQAVVEHLATCAECQQESDSYQDAIGALRRASAPRSSEGDWLECWQAVEPSLEQQRPSGRIIRLPTSFAAGRWLRAAALLLVALGIGIVIGRGLRPEPREMVASAHEEPETTETAEGAVTTTVSPKSKALIAKREGGPARRLYALDELVSPGMPLRPVGVQDPFRTVVPASSRTRRHGYYMDNIQLIGADQRRR